jgi:hypothetical protein
MSGTLGKALQGATAGMVGMRGAAVALGSSLGPVGIAAGAVGAAAAVAANQMRQLTDAVAGTIHQQSMLAQRVGADVATFTALTRAVRDYAGGADTVADVLGELSQRAVNNTQDFVNLGISVKDANGEYVDSTELLKRVADRIANASTETEQLAIADELASDAGRKLIEVLRGGRDAIDDLTKSARENNEVITKGQALLTREYRNAWRDVTDAFSDVQRRIGVALMPALEGVADTIDATVVPALQGFAWAVEQVFGTSAEQLEEYRRKVQTEVKTIKETVRTQSELIDQDPRVAGISDDLFSLGRNQQRDRERRRRRRRRTTSEPEQPDTLTPTRTFVDSSLLPNGGATITFGTPTGGNDNEPALGFSEGLGRAMEEAAQKVREKGSEIHAALGEVGGQGMELFGSLGESVAESFAAAFQGGDFGKALEQAVGQSITMMGVQLTQAGIMSLLLAPLSLVPFFGNLYGPPGKLAAIGAALTAGGVAMTGLGASMSGGGAPGGVRGGAGAGAGAGGFGGTQPLRDGGPRFGPEFGMVGGMQPRVINVQFNAPQDPRATRRMLTDVMKGRG